MPETRLPTSLTARLAGPLDANAIGRLMDTAWRAYQGFETSTWLDRGLRGDGWVACRGREVRGFMAVSLRPFGLARIVATAVANGDSAEEFAAAVLPPALAALKLRNVVSILFVGDAPWLTELLEAHGFEQRETVITYGRHASAPVPIVGNTSVRLQPADTSMLTELAALDRLAFGPIWHKPVEELTRVLAGEHPFVVAMHDGSIVGYQWHGYENEHGHINRLAVSPDWQGRGVGARLLTEAMAAMVEVGVTWITLNTQQSNARSRRLYERFGFERVGHPAPLMWKDLD
jgi:GNAT superfamily N-acetyltransferase